MNMQQVIMARFQNPILNSYSPSTPEANRFSVAEDSRITEHGNSLRFVHHFGKDLFYRHDIKKWYIWNGKCWEMDTKERVKKFAVDAIHKIREVELPHVSDPDEKGKLARWISKSLNKTRVNNVLDMSQSMLTPPVELDTDKYLLNVQNGTVNLKTGVLLEHSRNHYITKLANVDYVPTAECPKWIGFLEMAFQGDKGLIRYFQKIMGYCLTSDTSEKCFFICYGPGGNNGKSLIINIMRGIIGTDYCTQIASETLMAKKNQYAIRTDLVRLQGYRFASASETDRRYQFDEGLVKSLSGCDVVTARGMRTSEVEYTPEFKLFIATNHMPKFNINDPALIERVVVIPFSVTIPQDQRNRYFTDELLSEESEGILAWAVAGSVIWANEGLGTIELSEQPTVEIAPQSTFDHFLLTRCNLAPNLTCPSSELLAAYLEYHSEIQDDSEPLTDAAFYKELSGHNFTSGHGGTGNHRVGIALKSDRTAISSDLQ